MKQYVALYNDHKNATIYYYDMDEQCVYVRDDSIDRVKRNQATVNGAKKGGILGIFLYPIVGVYGNELTLIPMLICVITISLLGGTLAALYNIRKMEAYFLTLEKKHLKEDEIKALYEQGKKKPLEFIGCELCLLLMAIFAISFAWISKKSLVLIGGMVFLSIFWMLIISSRPICTLKWKLQMRKNNNA